MLLKLDHLLRPVGLVGGDVDDAGHQLVDHVAREEGAAQGLHYRAQEIGPAQGHCPSS